MISCRFSCDKCGLKDVLVSVPARESPDVDLVKWVNDTVCLMSKRHNILSPRCVPKSLQDIKIPIDKDREGAWVGMETDSIPPASD